MSCNSNHLLTDETLKGSVILKAECLDLKEPMREICSLIECNTDTVYWKPQQHRAAYGKQIPPKVNNQECTTAHGGKTKHSQSTCFLSFHCQIPTSVFYSSVFRYHSTQRLLLLTQSWCLLPEGCRSVKLGHRLMAVGLVATTHGHTYINTYLSHLLISIHHCMSSLADRRWKTKEKNKVRWKENEKKKVKVKPEWWQLQACFLLAQEEWAVFRASLPCMPVRKKQWAIMAKCYFYKTNWPQLCFYDAIKWSALLHLRPWFCHRFGYKEIFIW